MLKEVSKRLLETGMAAEPLRKVGVFQKKRSDMIGVNKVKIEDGLIKYEYSNKFNLRVNNYRRGGQKQGEAYTSLDKFVQE